MPTKSTLTDKAPRKKRPSSLPNANDAVKEQSTSHKSDLEASALATPSVNSIAEVSAEQREQMIRETAYYLAEKDGFQPGNEEIHWQQAEEQIDKMLKA